MPVAINGSGPITGVTSLNTTVSDTELGYLDGVTSAIQTQINANLPGMQLITTASFTAASSVNVNSCFTSAFDNYTLLLRGTQTADAFTLLRLRASGSDSAASYNRQSITASGTGVNASNATDTSFTVGYSGSSSWYSTVGLFGPALAAVTGMESRYGNFFGYWGSHQVLHNVASAYDGFSLISSSGTITGSYWLYGFRKA